MSKEGLICMQNLSEVGSSDLGVIVQIELGEGETTLLPQQKEILTFLKENNWTDGVGVLFSSEMPEKTRIRFGRLSITVELLELEIGSGRYYVVVEGKAYRSKVSSYSYVRESLSEALQKLSEICDYTANYMIEELGIYKLPAL